MWAAEQKIHAYLCQHLHPVWMCTWVLENMPAYIFRVYMSIYIHKPHASGNEASVSLTVPCGISVHTRVRLCPRQ